jgi:hypothetical protein
MKANVQIAPANLESALKILSAVANLCLDSDHGSSPGISPAREYPAEEYLTVRQIAARIKYGEQTVRNMMTAGVFRRGFHYYKRRGRVLFLWSRMEQWLREDAAGSTETLESPSQSIWQDESDKPFYPVHRARSRKTREAVL